MTNDRPLNQTLPVCDKHAIPNTVFGENLPDRFFERLVDLRRAQILLVMGTSLVVRQRWSN